MARRTVSAVGAFEGGVGRWVRAEEAREIADELAAVSTIAELQEWLASPRAQALGRRATAMLDYRVRLQVPDEPFEIDAVYIGRTIVAAAETRRSEAIDQYARERKLHFSHSRWGPRVLIHCATCGEGIGELSVSPFYCDDHREEEGAEVDALIAPSRR
ncbi:MAG TPA: hypothetical protein VJ716_04600 [Gaiellaceae bacterium]|nr:hypothetical protein [Gaiellaceae bacterium]